MGPPTLPQPVTPPPPASAGWRLALASALFALCVFAVGAALVAGLEVAIVTIRVVAASLDHVGGFDRPMFAVGFRIALILLPGAVILSHRALSGASSKGFRRWIPTKFDVGEAVLAAVGLLFLSVVLVGAEWNGNEWLPDELSIGALLTCLVLVGAVGPLVLVGGALVLIWVAYDWGVRSARRARGVTGTASVSAMSFTALLWLNPGATSRLGDLAVHPVPERELAAGRHAQEAPSYTDASFEFFSALVPVHHKASGWRAASTTPPAASASGTDDTGERPVGQCVEQNYPHAGWVAGLLEVERRIGREDAEDLAYDALLQVCEAHSIRAYSSVAAAITTAARRRATSDWRRRRRMVYGQPLDEIPCPVSPEDDSARMEFETQAMNHIFDGLSETARATINERARGKSFAEVGIALGVTEVKARDTFHNAIKKIQKELKDKCPREISL